MLGLFIAEAYGSGKQTGFAGMNFMGVIVEVKLRAANKFAAIARDLRSELSHVSDDKHALGVAVLAPGSVVFVALGAVKG